MAVNKTQEVLALICFCASFGLGYGYRNAQITTTTDQVAEVKDNHTVITTVTTKTPAGDVKTVKTVDSNTKSKSTENKQINAPSSPTKRLNVSALAGVDLSNLRAVVPVYGVSVTKQVLGPVTVGAFGLTNGVIGVSLGMEF